MAMISAVRLASIAYDTGFPIDDFLSAAASRLRADRVVLAGVVQKNLPGNATPCSAMILEDLASRDQTWISQDLGSQARGCKLDPRGLAEASVQLDRTLRDGAGAIELLMLNKFGKAEADGGGLRPAITQAIEAGIAVLTAVRTTYAQAWAAFHGGLAIDLPPESGAVLNWCTDAVRAVRAARRTKASQHLVVNLRS